MLLERKALTVRQFKELAESSKQALPESLKEHAAAKNFGAIEASFWKNLSYGEPPSYGADMSGSLYPKDMDIWNLDKLDTMLHRLMNERELPGVLSAYLYFGMWRAFFGIHVEDMNLFSINYLHFGAPKHWYATGQAYAPRIESLAEGQYPLLYRECHEFLRHKNTLIAPTILMSESIPVSHTVQEQGEYVITFPHGYHWGFNQGFNCAEATNFATEDWIPYGQKASWCRCIDDAVRIDMQTLCHRIKLFKQGIPNFKSFDPEHAKQDQDEGNSPTPQSSGRMRQPKKASSKKTPPQSPSTEPVVCRAKRRVRVMYSKILGLDLLALSHHSKRRRLCASLDANDPKCGTCEAKLKDTAQQSPRSTNAILPGGASKKHGDVDRRETANTSVRARQESKATYTTPRGISKSGCPTNGLKAQRVHPKRLNVPISSRKVTNNELSAQKSILQYEVFLCKRGFSSLAASKLTKYVTELEGAENTAVSSSLP